MKRVQHVKNATQKITTLKKVQHGNNAILPKCNKKQRNKEKGNMKKTQGKENATWKNLQE